MIQPPDYHARIFAVELGHWWHAGMRTVSASLLADHLARPRKHLLDVGCGTGGFLRWALDCGIAERATGIDRDGGAVELARRRVPEGDLRRAALPRIPFEDGSFDLVVANDVLQHLRREQVVPTLVEIRRVMATEAVLLVRTGGSRRPREDGPDWRTYDHHSLAAALAAAGFAVERLSYANLLPSLWASARRRGPRPPTVSSDGIPPPAARWQNVIGKLLLRAEARYLGRGNRRIPFGHTLLAIAVVTSKR